MSIKEIRALPDQELNVKLAELKQKLFDLKRKKAVGQLENPYQTRLVRKDIAKIETVKRERTLQINKQGVKDGKK